MNASSLGAFAQLNAGLLDQLTRGDRVLARQIGARLAARMIEEGGRKYHLPPVHFALDARTYDELSAAAIALLDVQTRMIRHLAEVWGREALLEKFQIPAALRPLVNWSELFSGESTIARLDILESANGYQFCEFNIDSCVAAAEIYEYVEDYFGERGVSVRSHLAVRPPLADLAALLGNAARKHDAARVVILDWSVDGGSVGKGYLSFDRLRAHLAREVAPIPVFIASEQSFDPKWLEPDEARRTFVYRGFPTEEMNDDGAFLSRLIRLGARVVSAAESDIRTDKLWFALFHDPAFNSILSDAERAIVAKYIPFTSALDPENVERFLADRASFVFKKRQSYGGAGVLIGEETSVEDLRRAIAADGVSNWTVQRLLRLEPVLLPGDDDFVVEPHHVVFGLYVYGRRTNGVLVRASRGSRVVNTTKFAAKISWGLRATPEECQALVAALARAEATPIDEPITTELVRVSASTSDEQARRELDAVLADIDSHPWPDAIEAARVLYDEMGPPIAGDIGREDLDLSGLRARMLTPPECDDGRVLLFLHGGGYVYGSLASHGGMAAEVARASRCRALQIEYRLAPEHPYPAAVEDAVRAYEWLLRQGYAAPRITILGDSAGGGLVLSTLFALREAAHPLPGAVVCISPWVDLEGSGESYRTRKTMDPMLDIALPLRLAGLYLGGTSPRLPAVAPLRADLRGLPPMLIQVGEREVLFSEAMRLAGRARAAGVPVVFEEWRNMVHVWHLYYPMLTAGRDAIARVGAFVREHTASNVNPRAGQSGGER